MINFYNILLKVAAVSALLAIPVVYFTLPICTSKAVIYEYEIKPEIHETTASERTTEKHENIDIVKVAEEDHTNKSNFCSEFRSKGVIIQSIRERRPGLLGEVSEAIVADDSIFFLETSCAEDLNPRQSCAVESAARVHPEKQVYVLLISPEANEGPEGKHNIGKLKSTYENINFYYIDIVNYTKGTKMEKWVENQALATSSYKVAHLSDGLRLLTLYKYGGIYLDLDVVVMHSLQNMSNFAGEEIQGGAANGVMNMKANGTLVNACLDEFVNNYHGDLWAHNGPLAIDRALKNSCDRKNERLWENCDGTFILYPNAMFYPIPWQMWQMYFEETNDAKVVNIVNNHKAIHVWNKLSSKQTVKVGSNVLYGVIASRYCPLSYWNSAPIF